MNKVTLSEDLKAVRDIMIANRGFLIELDARYGDGDLGISMENGFTAVCDCMAGSGQDDLGLLLRDCSKAFNQAAPSTLGTLFSFWFMGAAKQLKGKTEASLEETSDAMLAGVQLMMQRGKSAPGEKTIIDSIYPAVTAMKEHAAEGRTAALAAAREAAKAGLEATRNMVGKHGRIAYYGEKTLGDTDAGATAGMLIFEALK